MATTIAKLAAVITADTSDFQIKLGGATKAIRGIGDAGGGGFGRFADSLKFTKDAAGASGGSIRDMVGVLRSGAGVWGLAAVGVAAVGAGMYKAAEAADALELRAVKVADEWEAAYKKLNGKDIDIGFNKSDTWSGQWERMKEASLQFFAVLAENSGILQFFKDATRDIAGWIEQWVEYMKTPEQKARDAVLKQKELETAEMKKQFELQEKIAKEAEAAAKKLADERQHAFEAMERTAQHITQSLRTPDEIFRDTVVELKNLFQAGLLSDDVFSRGLKKAGEDLDRALDKTTSISKSVDTRVAAAERFTMAGFSAAQRSNEQTKIENNTRKIADNTAKVPALLQEVVVAARRGGSSLTVSNF